MLTVWILWRACEGRWRPKSVRYLPLFKKITFSKLRRSIFSTCKITDVLEMNDHPINTQILYWKQGRVYKIKIGKNKLLSFEYFQINWIWRIPTAHFLLLGDRFSSSSGKYSKRCKIDAGRRAPAWRWYIQPLLGQLVFGLLTINAAIDARYSLWNAFIFY